MSECIGTYPSYRHSLCSSLHDQIGSVWTWGTPNGPLAKHHSCPHRASAHVLIDFQVAEGPKTRRELPPLHVLRPWYSPHFRQQDLGRSSNMQKDMEARCLCLAMLSTPSNLQAYIFLDIFGKDWIGLWTIISMSFRKTLTGCICCWNASPLDTCWDRSLQISDEMTCEEWNADLILCNCPFWVFTWSFCTPAVRVQRKSKSGCTAVFIWTDLATQNALSRHIESESAMEWLINYIHITYIDQIYIYIL